jgi:hypothetical protein
MSATTTTTSSETDVPMYRVGDRVRTDAPNSHDGRVRQVKGDTIWIAECPTWCVGHDLPGIVEDGDDYDWSEHVGPDAGLFLYGLANYEGKSFREATSAHVSVNQVVPIGSFGWTAPLIRLDGRTLDLTSSEARSVAAMLLQFAELVEDNRGDL